MKINYRKKLIEVEVREVGVIGKYTGLMFRTRNTQNLLFDFKKNTRIAIHSYFVFFPFLALWLDDKNRVLEKKIVTPFIPIVKPEREFRKLVEIPLNIANIKLIDRFMKG